MQMSRGAGDGASWVTQVGLIPMMTLFMRDRREDTEKGRHVKMEAETGERQTSRGILYRSAGLPVFSQHREKSEGRISSPFPFLEGTRTYILLPFTRGVYTISLPKHQWFIYKMGRKIYLNNPIA